MNIILFGIKHSGKTTLGKEIAKILNLTFFDTDNLIEKFTGMSVRQLFFNNGRDAFMQKEFLVCKNLIESNKNNILLATGGGICDNGDAINLLKSFGVSVFIDTAQNIIIQRILNEATFDGEGYHNIPAFLGISNINSDGTPCNITESDIRIAFDKFYTRRTNCYKKIANIVVTLNDNNSIKNNAQKIIAALPNTIVK